jgi:hypothetical protein
VARSRVARVLNSRGEMRPSLAWLGVALFPCSACAETPDLVYADGVVDASSAASAPGDAFGGPFAADEGVPPSSADARVETDANESGAGTSSSSSSGGVDAAGPPEPDAGKDSGALACPSVAQPGVACCAGAPPSVSRTCVGDACTHCPDCLAAHCSPTQVCCPKPNGGGKEKVQCSDSIACGGGGGG